MSHFKSLLNTYFAELFISIISGTIVLLLRRWKKANLGSDGQKKTKGEASKCFKFMAVATRFSALIVVM